MRVLYAAPIKPVNFVRRTESKLDRLRASGRDVLQHNSTDQMSLDLVVVPDKVAQRGHGTGTEDHATQLTAIRVRAITVALAAEELALWCRIVTIATTMRLICCTGHEKDTSAHRCESLSDHLLRTIPGRQDRCA